MRKIFCILIFAASTSHCSFEFVDNKTCGALDKNFIKNIVKDFQVTTFFETGTYQGATTCNAAPYFKQVITVELFKELYESNKATFAQYSNIVPYYGKSPEFIRHVASSLEGKILFWLDAHYSGEGTALSSDDQEDPDTFTAIRGELAAIKEAGISDCVILIDDFRGFGIEIENQIYLGCWAYPTIHEVKRALLDINPNFELVLLGDMLLAYDKTKHTPVFSDTVIACTQTRLYDGYNLSPMELNHYEEIIKHAPAHEKEYIKRLYHIMTRYNDPMFWHDVWYGLVSLGDKDYLEAYLAFSKAHARTGYHGAQRPPTFKHLNFSDHILMLMDEAVRNF